LILVESLGKTTVLMFLKEKRANKISVSK